MERRIHKQMQLVEDDHWWFRGRRAVIEAMLTSVASPQDGIVLDAGCGSGGNLSAYTRFGAVIGVDVEAEDVQYARRRGYRDVCVASLPELPFRDAMFNLSCATDVIEHVADDVGALRELLRVTMPGGYLLITVPAHQWLWSDSDVQLGHHRRYRAPEVAERCHEAGWQMVRATYFNSALLPVIAAVRKVRQRRSSLFAATELEQSGPKVNRLLSAPMRVEARLIAAGVRLRTGVSIACLAQK